MIIFQGIARFAQFTIQRAQTLLQPAPKLFHQLTVSNLNERVPPPAHGNERQTVFNWNAVQKAVFGFFGQPTGYCELGCVFQFLNTNVVGDFLARQLSLDGVGCVLVVFQHVRQDVRGYFPNFAIPMVSNSRERTGARISI